MRLFEMINLQVTRGLPAEPGDVSLHHTLIAHSSRSNRSDDWRIGIGITYIATRAPHIGPTRLSAILARGTDRFNHFDHEAAPRPNSMIRACRACRLTVPLSESGVGCCGDAPYSLTVKQEACSRSAAEGGGPAVLGGRVAPRQQP